MSLRPVTFTLSIDCDHCGNQMPLNGPTRELTCGRCMQMTPVPPSSWCQTIADTMHYYLGSRGPYKCNLFDSHHPRCEKCRQHFEVSAEMLGQERELFCPMCGDPISTFPAPDWMKEILPGAEQLVGAQEESQAAAGEGPMVDVSGDRPVLFACPECNASLEISTDTARISSCSYCNAQVFIPDGLWLRLHPVKVAMPWTIFYRRSIGLYTREQLDEQARARELQEHERRQDERRPLVDKLTELMGRRRKTPGWFGCLSTSAFLAPIAAAVLTLVVMMARCGGVDPTGGLEGNFLCDRVCATCSGPFRVVTVWTATPGGGRGTNGPQYFCATPAGAIERLSNFELERDTDKYAAYEGDAQAATSVTYLLLLPPMLGLLLPILLVVRYRQRRSIDAQIAALAAELEIQAPKPVASKRSYLGFIVLPLAVAGAMVGVFL